jgi:hypothetical protein
MKVFNVTDASTAALRNQGLENQHIRVGETVIPPGGSATLRGTAKERSELQVYIKVGAVAIDELPPAYAAKRGLNLDGSEIPKPPPPPAPVEAPVEAKKKTLFSEKDK